MPITTHNTAPKKGLVQPYSFTGKEWCKSQWLAQRGLERGISETGYSYFGARYYDSDLSGLFLSVDPMSDKYPSLSPYAYCAWSPVKLVDPDGMEINPVYGSDGTFRGCTTEGFTGEIIIYDGTDDFSLLSADELIETTSNCSKTAVFYNRKNRDLLNKESKEKMYRHILGSQDGLEVNGNVFCSEDATIEYNPSKDGNWMTTLPTLEKPGFRLTITENYMLQEDVRVVGGIPVRLFQGYEATVENIISSAIYHEWYGHHVCGYSDRNRNHYKCYEASRTCPFYDKTTPAYKEYLRLNTN